MNSSPLRAELRPIDVGFALDDEADPVKRMSFAGSTREEEELWRSLLSKSA